MERTGKRKKTYVYYPIGESPQTCMIHGKDHPSEDYKVLSNSGKKYLISRGQRKKSDVHIMEMFFCFYGVKGSIHIAER